MTLGVFSVSSVYLWRRARRRALWGKRKNLYHKRKNSHGALRTFNDCRLYRRCFFIACAERFFAQNLWARARPSREFGTVQKAVKKRGREVLRNHKKTRWRGLFEIKLSHARLPFRLPQISHKHRPAI